MHGYELGSVEVLDGSEVELRMTPEPDLQMMRKPMTRTEIATFFGRATIDGVKNRRAFRDVERFCFLVGYPRSGSSLIGSLLNAHPEVMIAHEADALRYVRAGVTRNLLFAILMERDRQFASIGRQWNGFDYDLPGLDQGRFSRLRVIGDKKAEITANRLHTHPSRLDRLRTLVGVPIRAIHIVRNPFDTIASLVRNRGIPVPMAIDRYRNLGGAVDEVRGRLASDELLDLRYEGFIQEPTPHLRDVCRFLNVEATDGYVHTCVSRVDAAGRRGRSTIEWSAEERRQVEKIIASRPMLQGYSFTT